MENEKRCKKTQHQEAVQRFCPVVQKNVVMLRHSGASGDTFECVNRGSCDGSGKGCCHTASESEG